MTRAEAHAEAERRSRSGEGDFWSAQEHDGAWRVVRVAIPGAIRVRPSGAHTESRPKPSEPADPRPVIVQNIPPYGPGPG